VRELSYAEQLDLIHRLTDPATDELMRRLRLPGGSHGLDAGCGSAWQTLRLAELAGPTGRVTGLDSDPQNLSAARRAVGDAGKGSQVDLVEGDLLDLPFDDAAFDWAWCADVLWVGMVVDEPAAALAELTRVVRPGGTIALVYWSAQRLLPGYPALEARLDTAFAGTVPYVAGIRPGQHAMRALAWLRRAGLSGTRAETAVADVQGPLSAERRAAMIAVFDMLWGTLQPVLDAQDWAAYRRLCAPGSPDNVLDDPDYYGYVTYSAFHGRRP